MNDIVTKNEELFKVKAEIEWLVNQMENVDDGAGKVGEQEFDDLYGKIKGMIDAAKSKGTITKSISDYIHKLEEYASYLENFIRTNDKTLGSIKLEKQAPKNEAVEDKKSDETAIGVTASTLTKVDEPKEEVVEQTEVKDGAVDADNTGIAPPGTDVTGNAGQVATDASNVVQPPVDVLTPDQTLSSGVTVQQTSNAPTAPVVTGTTQGTSVNAPTAPVVTGTTQGTSVNAPSAPGQQTGNVSGSTPVVTGTTQGTSDNAPTAPVQPGQQTGNVSGSTPKGNTPKGNTPKGKTQTGNRKLVDDQLGGSNFENLIGGGSFIDQYKARSESMKSKLKKLFENEYANVQIGGKEFITESLSDPDKSKDFPIFFGKLATMSGLLLKLDSLLNNYNKLYDYLKLNPSLLRHDDASGYDLVQLWKDIFKAKKTDYYTDKLLKLPIYFYNYIKPEDKTIELEDALKNLVKQDEFAKITIRIDDLSDVKSNINDILNSLDNTVISFDHLNFFIENMVLTFLQGTKDKESDPTKQAEIVDSIKDFEQRISKRRDNLLKSAFLNTSGVYSILYGQTGGSNEIKLPSEPLKFIEPEDRDIFLELFRLYSSSILVPSDKSPMTLTNQKQIERTIGLTYMMMALYDKINLKLGSTDDRSMFAALTEEQKSIKKYAQFNELIEKLKESSPQTVVEVSEGKTQTSEVSKPRLDIYRNRLISCRDELKPYMKNIAILRNLLFETKAGTFSTEETKILISLYNKVKRQIEDGINSYIKLIPMIFFTIEFPPAVYATQKCKYRFTFDTKKEMVEYKFIDGQDKAECNVLGLGEFKETDFNPNLFNSHAAFFESNKLNGTKKLIDDPVIGLGKLIKQDESGAKPISVTINMMFALGASGTGKTTRYFGKSNGHPDDREGIVPYIINKSLEDAKPSDPTAPLTKKVSIAYFVCYGQKNQTTGLDAGFNELAIFFDINKIIQSNGGNGKEPDASVTVDEKYIPFYMGKTAEIAEEKVNKYTNFYSTVVNKKLSRSTYTELKGFITDGAVFPTNLNPDTNQKTFRDLLRSTNEIWKEIDPNESAKIGELFEELIIEQKKINTVLPTKNNIESSRGHTCVLVKIEDLVATTNKVKYFPLFDMAGTENTGQIDEFLKANRDKDRMAKLVQKVNTITQKKDILRADDETKQYPSLNDLLKYGNINTWVTASKNKYITLESVGGGKTTIKVEDFYNQELVADSSAGPGENFLNKVVKEGYYINHTISMLIYAAMCVGSSLRTELVNTEGSRVDKFDDFLPELFSQIDKFTCIPAEPIAGKTMMLLAKKTPGAIINASCIWLQILFSFLYWNEETPKSTTEWLQNISPDTTDALTYLCEPNVQSADVIPGLMTVNQLFKVGQLKDINDGLLNLYELMVRVNKSHEYTSAAMQKLGNKVSLVSAAEGKLKVEYEQPGAAKNFAWSESEIEIDNPDYDKSQHDGYKLAFELRKKIGLTEIQAKKAYTVPKDPGAYSEPTFGTAASKRSAKTTHDRAVAEFTRYRDSLTEEERRKYEPVQDIGEYTIPAKIKITAKIYYDFFENPTKIAELESFEQTLKTFESNQTYMTDFANIKKQTPTVKKGRNTEPNPAYDTEFNKLLKDISDKFSQGKFFYVQPKPTTPAPSRGKPPQPTPAATPAATTVEKILPLAEAITYSSTSSLGSSGEHVVNYNKIKTQNELTPTLIKSMLSDINILTQMNENKKQKDAIERKGFTVIPDVIAELQKPENIQQADLATVRKLLEETGSKLKLDTEANKFIVVKQNSDGSVIEFAPIGQVIGVTNQFPQTLPVCPTDPGEINKIETENQMHRIKDGRAAATKMTLMHLVTGQGVKHYMVEETIKLCKTLYDSTNLDLSV
jgi:hypothetical protein